MRLHRDLWFLLISAVAAVAAAPLIVHGDAAVMQHREQAAQLLEQMSPAERTRFDDNARRFAALAPEKQSQFREMHTAITSDASSQDALKVFAAWWPTVPARDRTQIQSASTAESRVAAIGTVQKRMEESRFIGRRFGPVSRELHDYFIGPGEFYRVMGVIESAAAEFELSKAEVESLSPLRSLKRVAALLRMLREHDKDFLAVIDSPADEQKIADALSNQKLKEVVEKRGTSGPRLWQLRFALSGALMSEVRKENLSIRDDDLRKELEKQDPNVKEDLYSLSADELQRTLRDMVLAEQSDYWKLVEFFRHPGENPGSWLPGRFGGRDGGRNDFNGRENGRGGDGGRGEGGRGEPDRPRP